MAAQPECRDWSVTDEKLAEAVRRIIEAANPLKIILFGSRARGDYRSYSDVDMAVIIDAPEEEVRQRLPHAVLRGIRMEVSLIVVSRAKYDLHRPWLNSVFHHIDREGVVLHDRHHPESARPDALCSGSRRRSDTSVSAL